MTVTTRSPNSASTLVRAWLVPGSLVRASLVPDLLALGPLVLGFALGTGVSPLMAQSPASAELPAVESSDSERDGAAELVAHRLEGAAPRLDGRLDDAAWQGAMVASGFTQFSPDPGAAASFQTEARALQ